MFTQEQRQEKNIEKLTEIDVLVSHGIKIPEAARQAGISIRTYYKYRKDHGRMRADQTKRLIDLEKENERLKQLMEEKEFDTQILEETLSSGS